MERFLAGGTDGRVLFVADGAEQTVVTVRERLVDQVRFALGTCEASLMPVLLLETHVLHTIDVINVY